MIWSMKAFNKGAAAAAVLAGTVFFPATRLCAQNEEANLAGKIQGTWVLVSSVNEQDGARADAFGPNPRGQLIYSADGHFSSIIMRAGLPKIASGSRMNGTAEEYRAVGEGILASFGTYTVKSEKDGTVAQHIVASSFPNWADREQIRIVTCKGNELHVVNPTPAIGTGRNVLVYKRAK